MARKPASMYRKLKGPANTRREYMGGVPGLKIVQFDMGNLSQDFSVRVSLVVDENCQIRHSALESARIAVNRFLTNDVGRSDYHLKIRVYPHHVLRENKQATGAGADRVSDGMRRAFGKPVGTAARVNRGQKVISVSVNPEHFPQAKESLRRAIMKLPTPCHIEVDKGEELTL